MRDDRHAADALLPLKHFNNSHVQQLHLKSSRGEMTLFAFTYVLMYEKNIVAIVGRLLLSLATIGR